MLEGTDPRRRDPFACDEQGLKLAELVESLVGTPYAETTAALTVIRAFAADELMAARVGRELEDRPRHGQGGDRGGDRARVAAVPATDLGELAHVSAPGRVDAASRRARLGSF